MLSGAIAVMEIEKSVKIFLIFFVREKKSKKLAFFDRNRRSRQARQILLIFFFSNLLINCIDFCCYVCYYVATKEVFL